MVLSPTCEAYCRHSLLSFSRHYASVKLSLMLDWQRVILMLALPLISLAVFLVVLVCIILCLLCRPSAKRTVTLRAIHLQQNTSSAGFPPFYATNIFLLHLSGITQHPTDPTLGEWSAKIVCVKRFHFLFRRERRKNPLKLDLQKLLILFTCGWFNQRRRPALKRVKELLRDEIIVSLARLTRALYADQKFSKNLLCFWPKRSFYQAVFFLVKVFPIQCIQISHAENILKVG